MIIIIIMIIKAELGKTMQIKAKDLNKTASVTSYGHWIRLAEQQRGSGRSRPTYTSKIKASDKIRTESLTLYYL